MKSCFAKYMLILMAMLWPGISIAGDLVSLANPPIGFDTQFVDPNLECTHRFSGTFNKGDGNKIIRAKPSILCLNSPGGSFVEALKVTSFMKTKPFATKIESGSRCESACALVFMAGAYFPHESEVAISWRILHVHGKLGFHSPALIVKEGIYDEKTIQKAYQLAMKSVSKLVFDLVHRTDFGGSAIKTSLLGEMLATPSNSMLFVETVDQAGRWEIMISGLKENKSPNKNQLAVVCGNSFYWDDDQSAISQFTPSSNFWMDGDDQSSGLLNGSVTMNEMTGSGCKFEVNKDYISMRINADGRDSYSVVSSLMFYDPSLKLVDLPLARSSASRLQRASGQCIIIKDEREILRESCGEKLSETNGKLSKTYSTASGARILIEKQNDSTFYNGSKTGKPFQFDGKTCVINPKLGTVFCFLGG